MNCILVFIVLLGLASAVAGWRECGRPSERVARINGVDVEVERIGDDDRVTVTVTGEASRVLPAASVVRTAARVGMVQFPLEDRTLGERVAPGTFSQTYTQRVTGPRDVDVYLKINVVHPDGSQLACVKDVVVRL